MILKFVMRDASGAVVTGTPTVTADGGEVTPTGTSAQWQVDAPLGSLVTATLTNALPLDVLMPHVDAATLMPAATYVAPDNAGIAYASASADLANRVAPATPGDVTNAQTAIEAAIDAIPATDLSTVNTKLDAISVLVTIVRKWFTNKRVVSATTQTVYDDDNVTPIATQALGVDGATFTRDKAV